MGKLKNSPVFRNFHHQLDDNHNVIKLTGVAMKIEGTNTTLTDLKNAPKVSSGGSADGAAASKSIGETPPTIVSLAEIGTLASLFAKGGKVSRLKRKLNKLKGKKCKVVPARGTIACVDDNDLVYLGVEFLEEFQDQEDVLAGVMAHEWGHACAEKPDKEEIQKLNWDEIFALRRSHEVLADEISGRLMALMEYSPDRFLKFLTREKKRTHNLKYHDADVRADIVKKGFEEEIRKMRFAQEIFGHSHYKNHYQSRLIDDDI